MLLRAYLDYKKNANRNKNQPYPTKIHLKKDKFVIS